MKVQLLHQLLRIAAWISQGINCIILFGHHDQTVSARVYLARERSPLHWQLYKAINTAFFWQDDHCYQSYADDLLFAQEMLRMEGKP